MGELQVFNMLDALFAELKSNYNIDFNRVYLTGLSMGGQGTWEWAKKQPKRFAAIVPICGYSDANKVKKIRKMPIWVFHGAKDTIVPIEESNQIVALLRDYKSQVKFTVYPEANHDSWTETYNNPKLFSWILSQKKN